MVPTPNRFSDPAGGYGVLYASEAVRCSFWEALVHNRFMRRKRRELPRSEVEDRVVLEPVTLSELIRHADFLNALDDYEVTLSSPQGTA